MDELERLRFYLRDTSATQFFRDEELQELIDATESFNEAIGLGWLVKASAAAADTTTAGALSARTVGKVSESYSTAGTSSASSALAMSNYWFARSGRSAAQWWAMEPSDGFIGEQVAKIRALVLSGYYDLSRLIP